MCGIYGILSAGSNELDNSIGPVDVDSFVSDCFELLRILPGDSALVEPSTLELLEKVCQSSYTFVERRGFLLALCDQGIQHRLEETLRATTEWIDRLEAHASKGRFRDQQEVESVNALITAGRDLSWRLEFDILGNLQPVRELLGGDSASGFPLEVWSHGWGLNLVLNNVNRLEVRGRDSAGVAVYVHFPSSEKLESFLSEWSEPNDADALSYRSSLAMSSQGAIVRPVTSNRTLLFVFKVANEIGEIGDNVKTLRQAIARDSIFQRALRQPGLDVQVLAHTRWASNGMVSVANCHPVDGALFEDENSETALHDGALTAVLNGDIDNYQELFQKYVTDRGFNIDAEITTDAKIIPVVVGHYYRETGDLASAFQRAFDEFEGSMAIGVMAADHPGHFLFGQKGSGQGLYIGRARNSTAIASEMYGVVELTQTYVKANGEHVEGGEIFAIDRSGDGIDVRLIEGTNRAEIAKDRVQQAEITTRDINRGEFPRFLLKEITESVETVRTTIQGKFEVRNDGEVVFALGSEVLDPRRLEEFRAGKIRNIYCIGQGTAAIAADGIAALLRHSLERSVHPIVVTSAKATEFSAHQLTRDMSDSLVLAVSQSGTTTDTNRTVDLARERGAWIIGVVNRRNSDLVYKSHGVLYTSNGRDVEMSVASTKAFYAQNVAGQILALALGQAIGSVSQDQLQHEVKALGELPSAMEETLDLGDQIAEIARRFAGQRAYWAVVGSGTGKIAADEIRIKLSELCYKSMASDYIEDKKHIDLSSEPLVLVCASNIPARMVSDVVKEVAIFKAHQSIPIVIADAGEHRFTPYAAGLVQTPVFKSSLSYLLSTMVGHLFGYHAASTFDELAGRLRRIRTSLVQELQAVGPDGPGCPLSNMSEISDDVLEHIREFHDLLLDGGMNSCLSPAVAVKISALFRMALGRSPLDSYSAQFGAVNTPTGFLDTLLHTLSEAINELARPIDAIKHQAKTITVGISRSGERAAVEGPLFSALGQMGLELDEIPDHHRVFLSAFEPLVSQVAGATVYRLENLDAVGRPRSETTIRAEGKMGCAAKIHSRCEDKIPLSGTKWGVAKSRDIYLGYGQTDGRRLLILPLLGEQTDGHLVLFHLELQRRKDPEERMRALTAHPTLLERLRIAVTEREMEWDLMLLGHVENDTLFFEDPEKVAEEASSQKIGG